MEGCQSREIFIQMSITRDIGPEVVLKIAKFLVLSQIEFKTTFRTSTLTAELTLRLRTLSSRTPRVVLI